MRSSLGLAWPRVRTDRTVLFGEGGGFGLFWLDRLALVWVGCVSRLTAIWPGAAPPPSDFGESWDWASDHM